MWTKPILLEKENQDIELSSIYQTNENIRGLS
jgi:hypothetical protein